MKTVSVKGFEGLYEVSENGSIYSCPKAVKFGRNATRYQNRIELKAGLVNGGYLIVTLFKDKVRHRLLVHRIVCMSFIPNDLKLPQVNHKDGNKKNNNSSNLEWVTASQNIKHAYAAGLIKPNKNTLGKFNEKSSRSKPLLQFHLNGELIKEWPCGQEVQRSMGFLRGNIASCARGDLKKAYGFKWKYKN